MALTVDVAFIRQFESEVHMAYQRMGSKLKGMARTKQVTGSQTTFQRVGRGAASQKSRHGNVPVMNIDHTNVSVTLQDFYAADYVDKLDELKINIDERSVVSQNAAAALGRRSDELLVTALMTSSNVITEGGTDGLTLTKINTVFEYFGGNDVPDDGQRYFVVSPAAWVDLLTIPAFSNADYIGSDNLPYKGGMVAKQWMGFTWTTFSGLTIASTIRTCLSWHMTSVGFATGQDVTTEINYVPEKAAHLITAMMSQGAVLIDTIGAYRVQIKE